MRDIKFRGKNIIGGKWVYGYFVNTLVYPSISYKTNDWYMGGEYIKSECIDINTLGQYTGLKDKNEKEIYEGDVLNCYGYKYEIKWCNGIAGFIAKEIGDAPSVDFDKPFCRRSEIIGNVYENPELLK